MRLSLLRHRWALALSCTAASLSVLLTAATALFYPADPLPGHTGGFGEPTCHTCHFDNNLNDPEGRFEITGLPEFIVSGETYTLSVRIDHPELGRAGFQLSARTEAGEQAGAFESADDRAAVTVGGETGIAYAHHTEIGAARTSGLVEWRLHWTAPETTGPVLIHASGNAANGDNSEFGDFIYSTEIILSVK